MLLHFIVLCSYVEQGIYHRATVKIVHIHAADQGIKGLSRVHLASQHFILVFSETGTCSESIEHAEVASF